MGIGDAQWILDEAISMCDGMAMFSMLTLYVWAQMDSRGSRGDIQSNTGYKAMADDRRRPWERLSAREREDSWRAVDKKGEAKGKSSIVLCPDWVKGKRWQGRKMHRERILDGGIHEIPLVGKFGENTTPRMAWVRRGGFGKCVGAFPWYGRIAHSLEYLHGVR